MVKSGLISVCLAIMLWMGFAELHQLLALKMLPSATEPQNPTEKLTSQPDTSTTAPPATNTTTPSINEASQKQFKQTVYEMWNIYDELELQQSVADISFRQLSAGELGSLELSVPDHLKLNQSLDKLLFPENTMQDKTTDFHYGYQASKEDRHGVHLELKKSGVAIRTDIQTDPEQGVEVQYIEIEVDLPN